MPLDFVHSHLPSDCRLLGPSAANVLQLTNTLFSGAQPRFHFIMNDDVHFISRNDDNLFEDMFLVSLIVPVILNGYHNTAVYYFGN